MTFGVEFDILNDEFGYTVSQTHYKMMANPQVFLDTAARISTKPPEIHLIVEFLEP